VNPTDSHIRSAYLGVLEIFRTRATCQEPQFQRHQCCQSTSRLFNTPQACAASRLGAPRGDNWLSVPTNLNINHQLVQQISAAEIQVRMVPWSVGTEWRRFLLEANGGTWSTMCRCRRRSLKRVVPCLGGASSVFTPRPSNIPLACMCFPRYDLEVWD
jgi:hypothetical protein